MSNWKPELEVDGEWSGNAQVFATKEEAELMARDIFSRWLVPTGYRASETEDAVNSRIENGKLVSFASAFAAAADALRPDVQAA